VRAETRHQLKQDRFSRATIDAAEATVHWSVEHKSKLMIGVIIVTVVVAAGVGGWYYLNQQDQKASVELSQAVRVLDAPLRPVGAPAQPGVPSFTSSRERATEAHQKFQGVVDKYPHTRSSDIARYFLGLTAADVGDNAAAERDLRAVASTRNDDLSSLAKFALASVYRKNNRNKEAIEIYKKLMEKPTRTVGKVMAEMELAAAYLADQQPLEAKRVYEQVQKENPAGPAAQMAASKLQELK
jgi:predicted negative regulator of RcsB-dependent stress response